MPTTESKFVIINVIRAEKPIDNARFVYYDIEGSNGAQIPIECNPEDSEVVFWQRVEIELIAIAQKYYPGKSYSFGGVFFSNPEKVVAFARETRKPV
jgi:hypothetical protein